MDLAQSICSYEYNIYQTAAWCIIRKRTLKELHYNKSWAKTEDFSYGFRVETPIIECNDSESLQICYMDENSYREENKHRKS